jgi:UDP-GlcNAc3NAcA epimerase
MILTIIGARPQFIKAAALSKAMKTAGLEERIIHTGQHYDYKMSEVFFEELAIPGVALNLEIGSGNHGEQTGKMLMEIENYVLQHKEYIDSILVYGDTNSTLAGALVGAKLHIPVIHVESGLRSFNRQMPEEVNRVMTDHLSDVLFCSSLEGEKQLTKEGITKNVHVVGDVMQDALYSFLPSAKKPDGLAADFFTKSFGLLTIHRPSNTDDIVHLQQIMNGIKRCHIPFIWPIHPRNRKNLEVIEIPVNLRIVDPLSYFEMLFTLSYCSRVITDSGGLQKEAYWLKKPCITVRPQTEWVETLHNNWNQLCDANAEHIELAINTTPNPESWIALYGKGDACKNIVEVLKDKK